MLLVAAGSAARRHNSRGWSLAILSCVPPPLGSARMGSMAAPPYMPDQHTGASDGMSHATGRAPGGDCRILFSHMLLSQTKAAAQESSTLFSFKTG